MRKLLPALLALSAFLAIAAAPASAAKLPTISKVKPLTAGIGDTITITGKHFRKGTGKNTVIFKADAGKAVFVKGGNSSSTRLLVTIPLKLRPFLKTSNGKPVLTRFRLRVLTSRLGKGFTPTKLSPRIGPDPLAGGTPGGGGGAVPAALDCDADGLSNQVDTDDDNDLLSDAEETAIKTNPCSKDSDADGVWDVYEYESALDMNSRNLPYAGKKPYPNPLDGSDLNTDFDGDGLTLFEEFLLWNKFGNLSRTLNYSDGKQATAPVLQGMPNGYGEKYPVSDAAKAALCAAGSNADHCLTADEIARIVDWDTDGVLSDEERDADGDGLSNWAETRGELNPGWWTGGPYKAEKPYMNAYFGTDFADPDVDGDGVVDGADDQDLDGWSNAYEASRGTLNYNWDPADLNPLGKVNPFNPCLPERGRANHCAQYFPIGKEWEMPDTEAPYQYAVSDAFEYPVLTPFPNPPLP
jgi:hypothetical protein